jgi:DNA-binding LacI/PurR family transcriptional regulator
MSSTAPSKKQRARDGLVDDVRRQIRQGLLRADQYLMSVEDLAKKYAVSSRSVREGLAHLEAEGLVRSERGKGTVVLPLKEPEVQKSKYVAVLLQGRVRDSSTAEELDGFQQSIQRAGFATLLCVADGSPERETAIVNRLVAEGIQGLVLYSAHPRTSYSHLQAALNAGMKIVVYDHDFPELDINFVGIDDRLAAREATEHLVRRGCRELLLINTERDWTTSALREQGFEDATAGLPRRTIRLSHTQTPAVNREELQRALSSLLLTAQRPLGIFAWWDEIALWAIDFLRQAGWSVPEDAKVVGIGNDASGELAEVPLTTMEVPRDQMTWSASTLLCDQMRGPDRPCERIHLKARMIIRESCGTYPKREKTTKQVTASPVTEANA